MQLESLDGLLPIWVACACGCAQLVAQGYGDQYNQHAERVFNCGYGLDQGEGQALSKFQVLWIRGFAGVHHGRGARERDHGFVTDCHWVCMPEHVKLWHLAGSSKQEQQHARALGNLAGVLFVGRQTICCTCINDDFHQCL